jgi:predicted hotdog family 3-hydroxylacyl-ACP dehydratase
MLLVERVVAWDAQHAVVAATPRADAWYSEQGAMPSWIGIELMAQAIAAHVGLLARSHGRPPKAGVLLGTRQYRATQPRFAAGAELLISARMTYRDETGLGSYDSTITLGDAQVAKARVNVYEPPDFAAFLRQQLAP